MHRFGLRGPDAVVKRAFLPHFERASAPTVLPAKWSYLSIFPDRKDQGDVGCCVSMTLSNIMASIIAKHFGGYQAISARALYALTQIYREESSIGQDVGMFMADCAWTAMNIGYAYTKDWPEQASVTPTYFQEPPASILTKVHDIVAVEYVGGYNTASTDIFVDRMKAALIKGPVGIGGPFAYDWEDPAPSGDLVSNPQQGVAGTHERVRLAYDDEHQNLDGTKGAFLDLNSWSAQWGCSGDKAGCYWQPYSTVTSFLPDDAYVFRINEAAELAAAA